MKTRALMTTLTAMAMLAAASGVAPEYPDLRGPSARPRGYGVHLSKAERRGKSYAELQRLRAERAR